MMKSPLFRSCGKKFVLLSLVIALVCYGAAKKEIMTVAQVEAEKGDVAAGKKLFMTCSACHGQTGAGVPNMGAEIAGKPVKEVIEKMIEVINGDYNNVSEKAKMMRPMVMSYTPKQVADVSAYVASMKKP